MQVFLDESILLTSIGVTLIHFLWQGLAIAAVLKILLCLIPKSKAHVRYLIATMALSLCLVVPIITFFYIFQPQNIALQVVSLAPIATLLELPIAYNGQQEWQQSFASVLPQLSIIWLCVVTLLAIRMLVEIGSVTRLPFQHSVKPTASLQLRFTQLYQQIGLRSSPRLRISLKTQVPMAIGFIKPVVVLPATMLTGLTPAQLDMLLLHELAHIRRHDYVVNLVQTFAEVILFFHPVTYWISKQIRIEREFCSDDIAVHHCGDAVAYAHTLADTATICNQHRTQSIPMMAMAASGGDLKARVLRLIQPHHCTQSNETSKWLASIVVILSIVLFATHQFSKVNHWLLSPSPNLVLNTLVKPQSIAVFEASNTLFDTDNLPQLSIANQLLKSSSAPSLPNSFSQPATLPVKHEQPFSVQSTTTTFEPTANNHVEPINQALEKNTVTNRMLSTPVTDLQSLTQSAVQQDDALSKVHRNKLPENKYAQELKKLSQAPARNELHQSPVILPKYDLPKVNKPEFIAATLLNSRAPKYPISAKRKKLEIEVLVSFTIDKQGYVKNIQFENKPKMSYFRSSVRHALNQWHFSPATKGGKVVESQMSKIFSFSLT